MADQIKNAFQKVKEDMFNLKSQLNDITNELIELKRTFQTDRHSIIQTDSQTDTSTNPQNNQTNSQIQTDNQTVPQEIGGLKYQNIAISTGNEGVPTDRQTNQQTDRHITKSDTEFYSQPNQVSHEQKFALSNKTMQPSSINPSSINQVSHVLNTLDSLKQDLGIQIKRLTPQEMLVFSTIYQLTDQNITPDYSLLAIKTNLSESSIRDYVQKLIKKGIPVGKTKENNKKVSLTIPLDFKRMASLQTLYELRNI